METAKTTVITARATAAIAACLLAAATATAQRMDDAPVHSKYIKAVDEYVPAPGQNVNFLPLYDEGDDAQAMARKCTECLADNQRELVSLGGFGGYITFHFDHSIANLPGQRDFAIWGNAYQEYHHIAYGGTNEAGVVMVSKDVNGNGLPDDPWYELSGSCDVDSVGKVDYGYEITYRKNPMGRIPWTDNRGGSGELDRLNQWHPQEYYPEWLPDGLTFRGTRLPDNGTDMRAMAPAYESSPYYWVLTFYAWGYADNQPNLLDDFETPNVEGCGMDIGWAVDQNRQPVSLDFVDFVRVYTGLNQKCGWLGETSTEILGAEDLHLDASLQAVSDAAAAVGSPRYNGDDSPRYYDLQGRRLAKRPTQQGVYLRNGKKITVK